MGRACVRGAVPLNTDPERHFGWTDEGSKGCHACLQKRRLMVQGTKKGDDGRGGGEKKN